MRIIFLNVWGGEQLHSLLNFFQSHRQDTDVFCLQEVFHTADESDYKTGPRGKRLHTNLFEHIDSILDNYNGLFAGGEEGYDYRGAVDYHQEFGLAAFVHENIDVTLTDDEPITDIETKYGYRRNLQYIEIRGTHGPMLLVHLHGIQVHHDKSDTPERIKQSNTVIDFLDEYKQKRNDLKIVLGGDFNLNPDTEALHMFEEYGLRNMIDQYDIETTRTYLYDRFEASPYADYCFVSDNITVRNFEVPEVAVSDHRPLVLDIDT